MKCDLCDKPAVVHEVTVRNGMKKEVHLCESHAKDAGIALPTTPINQLLTQFVISPSGGGGGGATKQAKAANKACPVCGLTFNQFRQTGKVGCPDCYRVFEELLSPLIERAQNGGTHHCGKTPRRCPASIDRHALMQRLMKELDHAVASEQYERAARIRDRIHNIDAEVAEPQTRAATPASRPNKPTG